jgi:hypothetical protein
MNTLCGQPMLIVVITQASATRRPSIQKLLTVPKQNRILLVILKHVLVKVVNYANYRTREKGNRVVSQNSG